VSYDILLEDDLDIPQFTRHVSGVEVIAQRVHFRLITFRGEWILDTSRGLPFVDWLTNKLSRRRIEEIGETVRNEILRTPGVLRIDNYAVVLDGLTLRISGLVYTDEGETFTITVEPTAAAAGNTSPFVAYQLVRSGPIAPL